MYTFYSPYGIGGEEEDEDDDYGLLPESELEMMPSNVRKYDEEEPMRDVFYDITHTSPGEGENVYFESFFHLHTRDDVIHFTEQVYHYFYIGGWVSMIVEVVFDFIISILSGVLSVLVLRCLDWSRLVECSNDAPCENVIELIEFEWIVSPSLWFDWFMIGYLVFLGVYYLWILIGFPRKYWEIRKMRIFYETFLRISYQELFKLSWDDVVERLKGFEETNFIQLHRKLSLSQMICWNKDLWRRVLPIVYDTKTWYIPLTIRAFFTRHLRKPDEPSLGEDDLRLVDDTPPEEYWKIRVSAPMTHSIETHCRFIIQLFSDKTVVGFRTVCVIYGVILLVCLPYIFLFLSVFWILTLLEHSKNRNSILEELHWTYYARSVIRRSSELSHDLDKRLKMSIGLWKRVSMLKRNPLQSLLRESLGYIVGSVLAVFIFISVIVDESVLLSTELWGRPIYWYIVVLTGAVTLIRGGKTGGGGGGGMSVAGEDIQHFSPAKIKELMDEMISWIGREAFQDLVDTLHPRERESLDSGMKRFVIGYIESIVRELLGVLALPWMFIVHLPKKSGEILGAVREWGETR